ncbi:hypothetical protein DW083_17260 [Parabacteroides sp. AF48-14]|uniref:hypothetical protein n=1 Tax=Parabacteroides sp. AF48-14 TaxID=2292052 RepID=UPI000EFDC8BA|nr:hypothetical protein [Parabacteroides sp. AF48-14]RHO67724.1 hypothetical protein DW083_17260 [Parabacteroides sp. AF48-14]
MESYSTVQERIKLIAEKFFKGNITAMAKSTFISRTTINSIIGEKEVSPGYEVIRKIVDNSSLNINPEWLLTGKGEMLNRPTGQANATIVENPQYMKVPVVHIHAKCGYLAGYGDLEYIKQLPTMPVIVDKTYLGKYMIFEAAGDSMDDDSRRSICDGDKVLGREVMRDLWRSKLHINDWYFIIVHKTDGISIKKIIDHDVEKGIITCHSLNPLFKDYKIHLDDVAELYNVIKIVERSARL